MMILLLSFKATQSITWTTVVATDILVLFINGNINNDCPFGDDMSIYMNFIPVYPNISILLWFKWYPSTVNNHSCQIYAIWTK